uniref:Exocyst complex component 3 like 4 n=1 Tax=Anser brachyrhynchus TaxID=132585 RepID=A0A8B9I6I4_9AVES
MERRTQPPPPPLPRQPSAGREELVCLLQGGSQASAGVPLLPRSACRGISAEIWVPWAPGGTAPQITPLSSSRSSAEIPSLSTTGAERDADKYKDNPQEFVRKTKDVDLLYNSIKSMIQSIVVGTLEHPTVEEATLASLVTLIAREEAAHPNAGSAPGLDLLGSPRRWREEWREAINESARKRVLRVPMASKEEESSWLDLHLCFLQKHLSEDLLKIKLSVKKCYPEEYQVCDIYVEAFHKAIASHLQDLSQQVLEFNELYSLLDWVANTYRRSCEPPALPIPTSPPAASPVLGKIKSYFGNILRLEVTEKWEKEVHPEVEDNLYHSSLSFDIQTVLGELGQGAGCSGAPGGAEPVPPGTASCRNVCESRDVPGKGYLNLAHWGLYGYHQKPLAAMAHCGGTLTLGQEHHHASASLHIPGDISELVFFQPLLKKILTKDWILATEKPDSLAAAVSQFSKHLQHTRQPLGQELLRHVHKYMVREYIVQVIKPRRKMNRETRQHVSERMNQEAKILNNVLGSDSDWLLPAIHHIADIVGEKKKDRIKEYVKELSQDYPDIRKEHILAILMLRGMGYTRRAAIFRQSFHRAPECPNGRGENTLFDEIDVSAVISCF